MQFGSTVDREHSLVAIGSSHVLSNALVPPGVFRRHTVYAQKAHVWLCIDTYFGRLDRIVVKRPCQLDRGIALDYTAGYRKHLPGI